MKCSRTLWNVSKQAKGFRTLWKRNLDMMQTSQNVFQTLWILFPKHIGLFSNKSMYEHFWNVHILNCSWIIWIVSKQIWMFQNILKIKQSTKQVRMFRNTFENFQMFRNTFQNYQNTFFEMFTKHSKSQNVFQNKFEKSECFPK